MLKPHPQTLYCIKPGAGSRYLNFYQIPEVMVMHTLSEDLHLQKVHPRFSGPQGILHCNSALVFPES